MPAPAVIQQTSEAGCKPTTTTARRVATPSISRRNAPEETGILSGRTISWNGCTVRHPRMMMMMKLMGMGVKMLKLHPRKNPRQNQMQM